MIEIERQLNPLKDQAEKARKYLELRDELKSLEINNYIYTYYRPKAACLKEFRKRRGLTQEELARRSGVSLRMVRAYEQGQQDLSRAESSTLLRLSQALNCPPERLIEGLD